MNDLDRLLPRHYTILDLHLAGNGPKEIAQAVGMTAQAVSGIVRSPLFQDEVARRRGRIEKEMDAKLASVPTRARQLLEQSAEAAAQTLVNLLGTDDPRVQKSAADSILERVFGEGTKHAAQVVVLEPGALQLLSLALEESNDRQTWRQVLREEREWEEEPGRAVQLQGRSGQEAGAGGVLQTLEERTVIHPHEEGDCPSSPTVRGGGPGVPDGPPTPATLSSGPNSADQSRT